MRRAWLIILILLFSVLTVSGQTDDIRNTFKEIVLKVDTLRFTYSKNRISYQGHPRLSFYFNNADEVCELNFFPADEKKISSLELLRSSDFTQLDSVVFINHEYFRVKIKFINLNKSRFLNLFYNLWSEGVEKPAIGELKLLPYTKTTVSFYPTSDELYVGEEKTFELLTNNISNVRIDNEWTTGQDINYRISENNGLLSVHLLPNSLGSHYVNIKLQTNVPFINDRKQIVYDLPAISLPFKVKSSRLAFLNIDKKDITLDDDTRKNGIAVQLDNHRQLIAGKTYRLEEQEKPGGALIAELFTKNSMANDRVLCIIRPFNLHRQTSGYLYIKDGDEAKFITNVGITPKTTINNIQIMHEGQDWTSNLSVYPGEKIDVKIEGEGLNKARFHWDEVEDVTPDTLARNENLIYFQLRIPMNISKKQVILFNNVKNTGYALNVKEYQIPHNLDFLLLDYGQGSKSVATMKPSILDRKTIKDITISFDPAKIDVAEKLFGKQYLELEIKIVGKKNELIETKTIKNLLFCPGDNSPRAAYYKDKSSTNVDISLNSQLTNKTYNLSDFSKIQLDFRHHADKYSENGYSKQIDITLQRPVIFDIDVSFPAGLMIQNLGKTQTERDNFVQYEQNYNAYKLEYDAYLKQLDIWTNTTDPIDPKPVFSKTEPQKPKKAAFTDNIGGISLALIMQFSFPDAEREGHLKPYRLGVGFLAINTFNFSETAKRDLAAVVLASVYPIKPGRIFNLPIHIGFGYKFQDKIPFIMLSPGIGIQF